MTIRFTATIGDAPFDCQSDASIAGFLPSDLRFFVHDVRLVNDAGTEVPVTLDQDGRWQTGDVALLDFENGKGRCRNGSLGTHDAITGRVPGGRFQAAFAHRAYLAFVVDRSRRGRRDIAVPSPM